MNFVEDRAMVPDGLFEIVTSLLCPEPLFECRTYVGLMRHLILSLVAMGIVAEGTHRLRGKNPTPSVTANRSAGS